MVNIVCRKGCGLVRKGSDLVWFAVFGEHPWVGLVLRSHGCGVFEFLEDGIYVARNVHVTCACFVVPFEGEAKVESSAPVGGDLV